MNLLVGEKDARVKSAASPAERWVETAEVSVSGPRRRMCEAEESRLSAREAERRRRRPNVLRDQWEKCAA